MVPVKVLKLVIAFALIPNASGFWDMGTSTVRERRLDDSPRVSFFRWQWVYPSNVAFWYYWWDWPEIENRRRLNTVAGISIGNPYLFLTDFKKGGGSQLDLIPLSTAAILNRRVLLTSYNYLDPYMNRQHELRIWALGRAGKHTTPFRYRVHRVTRLLPLSSNTEHCHGPRCIHQPRHDVALITSLDQMYIFDHPPVRYHYAYRAFLPTVKKHILSWDIWMAGSGYEYMEHIQENYKIFYFKLNVDDIVDCSKYLPKYWGKFICIKNTLSFPGVQNGGPLFDGSFLVGVGCFEIRYNEDRLFVFTDLRYYLTKIKYYAHIWPGLYYEYAYPQWAANLDPSAVNPNEGIIPAFQLQHDLYPLG